MDVKQWRNERVMNHMEAPTSKEAVVPSRTNTAHQNFGGNGGWEKVSMIQFGGVHFQGSVRPRSSKSNPPIRKVNGKSVVAVDRVQPGWRGGLEDQEERVVVGGLKNGIFIPLMNTLEISSSLWACRTTKSDPKCGPRRSRMRSLVPDPSARETDGGILLVGGWRLLRLRWTLRRGFS